MKRLLPALVAVTIAVQPATALAWGNSGHRIVGEEAMRALPSELPGFLRTAQARLDVGELSREPDRSKGSGKIHDQDRDPGHFLDLDDDGKLLGGPVFPPLPPTREDFEAGLQAAKRNSWDVGYLPYSIIDRWQQLTTDFAYWRILAAAEKNPKWKKNRAWFAADRRRREALILKDIGELSHFVGDGSQPLHVTSHYNGWGDGPNPNGYSNAKLHGPFESELVFRTVRAEAVRAQVAPLRSCNCPVEQRTVDYLMATQKLVIPFYEMEKAGGLAPGDPRGTALAVQQIAVGASELRDLIADAWKMSVTRSVGWRPVKVDDVLAGRVDPYPSLYGID